MLRFQSTLLMRGATRTALSTPLCIAYFNPRSSCEERRRQLNALSDAATISIHAPHARSDGQRTSQVLVTVISIHAPHARSDGLLRLIKRLICHISIHAPHARSDKGLFRIQSHALLISIHAPHARSDRHAALLSDHCGISIHAPHARSDATSTCSPPSSRHFNPRSSCEERHSASSQTPPEQALFQSTLLMRGATRLCTSHTSIPTKFQSTLLMRGATCRSSHTCPSRQNFNPRSSCEERQRRYRWICRHRAISIHAPHARSDESELCRLHHRAEISIHAPHARSDFASLLPSSHQTISIHAPHARSDERLVIRYISWISISIHAPHARSDQYGWLEIPHDHHISIHAPHARSD